MRRTTRTKTQPPPRTTMQPPTAQPPNRRRRPRPKPKTKAHTPNATRDETPPPTWNVCGRWRTRAVRCGTEAGARRLGSAKVPRASGRRERRRRRRRRRRRPRPRHPHASIRIPRPEPAQPSLRIQSGRRRWKKASRANTGADPSVESEPRWLYLDDTGAWQGPFSRAQLRAWRAMLPMDLVVADTLDDYSTRSTGSAARALRTPNRRRNRRRRRRRSRACWVTAIWRHARRLWVRRFLRGRRRRTPSAPSPTPSRREGLRIRRRLDGFRNVASGSTAFTPAFLGGGGGGAIHRRRSGRVRVSRRRRRPRGFRARVRREPRRVRRTRDERRFARRFARRFVRLLREDEPSHRSSRRRSRGRRRRDDGRGGRAVRRRTAGTFRGRPRVGGVVGGGATREGTSRGEDPLRGGARARETEKGGAEDARARDEPTD